MSGSSRGANEYGARKRSRVGYMHGGGDGDRPSQHRAPSLRSSSEARGNREFRGRGSSGRYCNDQRGNRTNRSRSDYPITLQVLKDIASSDTGEVIVKTNQKKTQIINLLNAPLEQHDLFVVIMEIITKISTSSFNELKLKLLLEFCNTNFISNLHDYLLGLPFITEDVKKENSLYWNNQNQFWVNFVTFLENFMNLAPSFTMLKLKSLIDTISRCCLDGLNSKHGFALDPEYNTKLKELREKLTNMTKKEIEAAKAIKARNAVSGYDRMQPPQSFRELSVMPTREDLVERRPFLRPNIVDGSYQDVEHYLDVQFRLLREDCFGPLRDGINQYFADPNRKKYDNIRIYKNVRFVSRYVSQDKLGEIVQCDRKNQQWFSKVNWSHSKRFTYGSLLLFTKDNCKSFITATVLDRDIKLLQKGQIPVSIVDKVAGYDFYSDSYIMIESEVFFESYIHVLRALQEPSFPEHLAMKKYIVDVDPTPTSPEYLQINHGIYGINKKTANRKIQSNKVVSAYDILPTLDIEINIEMNTTLDDATNKKSDNQTLHVAASKEPVMDDEYDNIITTDDITSKKPDDNVPEGGVGDTEKRITEIKKNQSMRFDKVFQVLDNTTWPSKEDLELNDSQYEAYRLALTQKFAVIQGPPGTGKTYVGAKIATTLIQNVPYRRNQCLMLIICYTNHALDQFLEHLLSVTKSIVRIGGQSRNEALTPLNLTTLRKYKNFSGDGRYLCSESKDKLRSAINALLGNQKEIEHLNNSVISYNTLKAFVPHIQMLGRYYENYMRDVRTDDVLHHWLFERMQYSHYTHQKIIELAQYYQMADKRDNDDSHSRISTQFDNLEVTEPKRDKNISLKLTFSVNEAEDNLKKLLSTYCVQCTQGHINQKVYSDIVDLMSRINFFNDMSADCRRRPRTPVHARTDFSRIPVEERWAIYFEWANSVTEAIATKQPALEEAANSAMTAYEEARMILDLNILRGVKVVGMTTTGAARLRKLLQTVEPKIVIVEEAAEVLEQHIVTALTKSCQHLILIGDHKQLRPSAAHMRLARQYNLEVSLFERMVRNSVHCSCLNTQHRMRPEFASLIVPHVYTDLQNHPSVNVFPSVRGVAKNLFFFTHNHQEELIEDGSSRFNQVEGDIVLKLANYLMQQGYEASDVTVLATYSGQMFYLKKIRVQYPKLAEVKITVVDNYQGEESKIILLSLVRNNDEENIGFLGTENRVCVALSRAREGLFIFGNIALLKSKSELWDKISTTLESTGSVGTELLLKCENHNGHITKVSSPEDFDLNVPEGGCMLKCDFELTCGHTCPLICHGYDRQHNHIKCTRRCERISPSCSTSDHVCPLQCKDECQLCRVIVRKLLLCGHENDVICTLKVDDPAVKCSTKVSVKLPKCGHEVEKLCCIRTEDVKCPVLCEYSAQCGHACTRTCHVDDDPQHDKYVCHKPCARAKLGCTADLLGDRGEHQCRKECHEECDFCTVLVEKKRENCKHSSSVPCMEDVNDKNCTENCSKSLPCGHFCKKQCFQTCGDCDVKVVKTIERCNHKIPTLCRDTPDPKLCEVLCNREMPCGHKCLQNCGEECDQAKCTELVDEEFDSPCGHKVKPPCGVYKTVISKEKLGSDLLAYCKSVCGLELACGHTCRGTCSGCKHGRLHAPCTQTCKRINICGHECKAPCNQACPPCYLKCTKKCPHSKCNDVCGAPCTPCQERCKRGCLHGRCKNRCGEPCSRAPCEASCPRNLQCGHPCRGLCGEFCPRVCKLCDPDNFPTDFLGDLEPYGDDVKLIQLQDCSHVFDVESIDNIMMMSSDQGSIEIRTCPLCRTPIINTYRYKDLVNYMFKTDINRIKKKVYGDEKTIAVRKTYLMRKIRDFLKENQRAPELFTRIIRDIENKIKPKKTSLPKIETHIQRFEIIEMILEHYRRHEADAGGVLFEEFKEVVKILVKGLIENVAKASLQFQNDMRNEIKRLNSITQLAKIVKHTLTASSAESVDIKSAEESAREVVFYWGVFDEEKALKMLKEFETVVAAKDIVSKAERDLVIKAIGSQATAWYKCPNDHIYAVGNCGSAVQGGKCADCGARIGTGSASSVSRVDPHAVDVSKFAAWSNAYNVMGNWRL